MAAHNFYVKVAHFFGCDVCSFLDGIVAHNGSDGIGPRVNLIP